MQLALATKLENLPAEVRDRKIIDLCDAAISGLSEARSLEDVFGIRNAAEAFSTYTRKWKCAVEAQASTQLVVLLAEARIGAELTAAQERGEVATPGGDRQSIVRTADNGRAALADIGIPRQRAAEFKKLAEIGEPAIREEVKDAVSKGQRPSRERIIKTAAARPRRVERAIPALARRPPELDHLSLWLRTGVSLVAKLKDPAAAAASIREHPSILAADQVEAMASLSAFLNTLHGALQ